MRPTYRFGLLVGDAKQRLDAMWYGEHPLSLALAPLAMLVGVYTRLRRAGYRREHSLLDFGSKTIS